MASKKRQSRRHRSTRLRASTPRADLRFDTNVAIELKAAAEGEDGKGSKTFDITAYNGGSLSLPAFDAPVYIDCGRCDVHGNANQQPILRDHDTRALVGHGRPVIEATGMRVADGVISHDTEASREIIAAASKGFEWQASVGGKIKGRPRMIDAGQTVNVNNRSVSGPAYIVAMRWLETSFCGIGCDDERASARVAAAFGAISMDFNQWLEASGFAADDLEEKQLDSLKAMWEKETATAKKAEEDKVIAAAMVTKGKNLEAAKLEEGDAGSKDSQADKIAASASRIDPGMLADQDTKSYLDKVRSQRRAEDARIADLEACRLEYKELVPSLILASHFDKAIAGEYDRNTLELHFLKEARQPRSTATSTGNNRFRRRTFDRAVVEAALLRTGGMQEDGIAASITREHGSAKTEEVMNRATEKTWQGFGLQDLVFASIESAGEEIPSRRIDTHTIETAFRCSQSIQASNTSTVSLPGILSNIANKQMLQSYEDNMGIWPQICSTTDTSDFKQFDSYRLSEAGILEPVGPSGEIKHSSLSEDAFSNRVVNHAKLIGLTEEMITNDDLGAFQQLSRHFGRMSAHAIEQTVIQTLLSAPTAATSSSAVEFFHGDVRGNDQPNYLEGADSALSTSSLSTAWGLFANQTDREGKPVMLTPSVLLTTTQNAVQARNLYNSATVEVTGSTDRTRPVNNEWHQMFAPAYSAYLHQAAFNGGTAQTTQWYLVAGVTDDFAALQVAFLRGQRTPQIERFDYDPNMLGATFRARLPFGVAMADARCMVKSKGKA